MNALSRCLEVCFDQPSLVLPTVVLLLFGTWLSSLTVASSVHSRPKQPASPSTRPYFHDIPVMLQCLRPFLNGAISGVVSTLVVHPMDTIKIRKQLNIGGWNGKSTAAIIMDVAVQQGDCTVLYTGLGAGLLRQLTYATFRIGFYELTHEYFKVVYETHVSFALKMAIALVAGGLGALVGTPFQVLLVRAQGSTNRDETLCQHIRNNINDNLWKGWEVTTFRAMLFNVGQLAVYYQAKEMLQLHYSDGGSATLAGGRSFLCSDSSLGVCVFASVVAAFTAALITIPVDNVKTRLQINGNAQTTVAQHMRDIYAGDGVCGFCRGFTPYALRCVPHVIITLFVMEIMHSLY